jgi:hypothetical protein
VFLKNYQSIDPHYILVSPRMTSSTSSEYSSGSSSWED